MTIFQFGGKAALAISTFALLIEATASTLAAAKASQLSIREVVDMIAPILVGVGEDLSKETKVRPPQILFGIGGTSAYGGCIDTDGSSIIPGSYYCAATNTIILEVVQLEALRNKFGDGAVAYALFHEFGHYVQHIFNVPRQNTAVTELHADCMAGMMLSLSAKKLQLDEQDLREIYQTAYSLGSDTHGSGPMRLFAVKYGFETSSDTSCVKNALAAANTSRESIAGIYEKTNIGTNPEKSERKSISQRDVATSKPLKPLPSNGYLGQYILWGSIPNKLYKVKQEKNYFKLKTMTVRYVDQNTGIAKTSQVYVDCGLKKWSFFPDLPDGQWAHDADLNLLTASGCTE